MSRAVLDAGALIALERGDRSLWAVLKVAALDHGDVLVPTSALAQIWRGGPTQAALARALPYCTPASFDDVTRAIGELCGRSQTSDVCDAHVALVASLHGDTLYTSDPDDMRRLIAACGKRRPRIVRC